VKSLAWRVQAEWRLKLALTAVFNVAFWMGYQVLGRNAVFPIQTVPRLWLDFAIPYQPIPWAWVYLSQFIFTSTLPWLLSTRSALRRFCIGLTGMTATSFAVFLILPTQCVRPAEFGFSKAMQIIAFYDAPLNAFPSLHAAFLAYMAALACRLFSPARRAVILALCFPWGLAILYATLATKQHHVLDLVAGFALGFAADWLAWRRSSAAETILVSNDVATRSGVR
jgi:membrane-associated phospholipid phosphatase